MSVSPTTVTTVVPAAATTIPTVPTSWSPHDMPTLGEVAGTMVRYAVWCFIAGAIVDGVRAAWQGDPS